MNFAKPIQRIVAYIIDYVICHIPSVILAVLLFIYVPSLKWYCILLLSFLLYWLSFIVFNSFFLFVSNGFTLGGLIAKVRVVRSHLERLQYRDAFVRAASLGLLIMVIVNVFYMLIVHTERTIFDRISDTIVISYQKHKL